MSRIYDISVPIRTGGLVYPGNPEIEISLQQAVAKGAGANVSFVRFGSQQARTPTPRAISLTTDRASIKIPLERLIGPAILLAFDDDVRAVGAADLQKHEVTGHTRVLLRTRNSALLLPERIRTRTTPTSHPDGAQYLVTTASSWSESTICRSSSSTPATT